MRTIDALFGENAGILRQLDFRLLLLVTVPYPLGIGIVSPILNTLTGSFGVPASTIGLVVTAFYAPAIVATPLAGTLADRYGRKPLMVIGLLLFGIGGTAIVATTNFRLVLGLRLLQGIGAGTMLPVIITSIGDLYAKDEEATAQGIRTATHALSGAVGPVVAGALVVIAWQHPFLLYALTFPIAFVVFWFFEEPADDLNSDSAGRSRARDLVELVLRPDVLSIVLAFGIPPFLYVAFLTYNSFLVVRGLGGTPGEAGVLVAIASLAVAVAASQAGRITAFFATRLYPLLAANVAIGAGLVAVALSPTIVVGVIAAGFLGFGFGLLLALYRSIITSLAPEHHRGGLVSIGEASKGLSSTGAPLVLGALIELTQPTFGVVSAVRWMNVAVGALGAVAGIVLVLVARTSSRATTTGR